MKNVIRWIVALTAAIIMCSCASDVDKLKKVEGYYRSNGYCIRGSNDEVEYGKLYLLVEKNNVYYLDTKFKSNGKSAQKIYPNEKGSNLKTLEVSFNNGIKGAIKPLADKDHIPSFKEVLFHDDHDKNGKDLIYWNWPGVGNYYYIIGSQDALYLNSSFNGWNTTYSIDTHKDITHGFRQIEAFTFADLYDDFEYRYGSFSLEDYPIIIEENFSTKDLSFLGFSNIGLKKTDYPWQRIKDKIGQNAKLIEDNEYLYFPASWIGTIYMDNIKECIDNDINEKEAKLEMERRQREQEEAIKQIQDNAVDFNTMRSDYSNPFLAEKKYPIGQDMLLKIRIDKIEYSYTGYTYVLSWLGSFTTDVYIYTNDNNFAELDYPQIVWIQAKYSSRHEAWDNTVTYKFTDAQLLLWKEPGLFE